MATRFEIVLHGHDPVALRAAGEEAFDEIDRLEARLSLYQPTSEIARVNAQAAESAVRVSPDIFHLLEHAQRLRQETGGAFDITIAPLVRCWGFMGGRGAMPDPAEVAEARARVGMNLVELDSGSRTVRFARAGVMLDLGAIGKGYAIDCAAEILREAGVTSALLHGGTSTAYAIGQPPGEDAWKLAVEWSPDGKGVLPIRQSQQQRDSHLRSSGTDAEHGQPPESALLAVVSLRDESLSVSAIWGRAFESGGRLYGHVIDPRTGEPASEAMLAAVVLPSATETDAISTALLTMGSKGHDRISGLRAGMSTLVAGLTAESGVPWREAHGPAFPAAPWLRS